MPFDDGKERARNVRRWRAGADMNRSFEAVLIERLAWLVFRLGDAVIVGHEQVAGGQLGLGLFVGGRVEHPERDAAGGELLDGPVQTTEERWCLPGVDVREVAGSEVDDREKEGDESCPRGLLIAEPVETLDERRRWQIFWRQGAQHRQQQRHQQRRRAALPGDVSQDDHDPVVVQPPDVVEIASHRVGRSRVSRYFDAAADECVMWPHRELDVSRDLQVVLQIESVGYF